MFIKRSVSKRIDFLKKRIQERGDDMEDADFEKLMKGNPQKKGKKGPGTLDRVRETV